MPAADRMVARLDTVFQKLARNPGMGRLRDEIGEAIRTFPVGDYLVMYRPVRGGVGIVRVVHGARDLGSITLK